MHPVLFSIGSLKIHSYGVMVALGILAAIGVAGREIERKGIDRETFYDMAIWAIVAAVAGARLFHVLVYWPVYAADPREIYRLWNGGLVFYGGLLAAAAVCVAFLRRRGLAFLPVADAAALGIPLGLAFGRVGCLLAGCCYGKPATVPWAVVFTNASSLATPYIPLHPTQLYESLAALAIFGALAATRKRFVTPGMRFWTMLILYGIARAALEIFRNDPRGFAGPFSESQIVSAVLVLYACVSIAVVRSRAGSSPLAP